VIGDDPGMTADRPADVVRRLYELRAAGDPGAIRQLLHPEVRWREPEVGDHMGELMGADAVVDMIERALAATSGTFSLRVEATIETESHCAARIAWTAEKPGGAVAGHELAVYGIRDGLVTEAAFFPEDLADDTAFWA
jgi:ketosteroid isomerase-like protein